MATPQFDDQQRPPTPWMSLSEASHILGVSQGALRQWADQGQVRSFRTPGGHRRFAREDLNALLRTRHLVEQSSGLDTWRDRAVVGIRRRMQARRGEHEPWSTTLDETGRDRLRLFGRQLMALVADAVAQPRSRSTRLAEARSMGTAYGREGIGSGLPLADLLQAFVFFRSSVGDTARAMARREGMTPAQVMELWQQIEGMLDAVLLAAAAVYAASPAVSAQTAPAPA